MSISVRSASFCDGQPTSMRSTVGDVEVAEVDLERPVLAAEGQVALAASAGARATTR